MLDTPRLTEPAAPLAASTAPPAALDTPRPAEAAAPAAPLAVLDTPRTAPDAVSLAELATLPAAPAAEEAALPTPRPAVAATPATPAVAAAAPAATLPPENPPPLPEIWRDSPKPAVSRCFIMPEGMAAEMLLPWPLSMLARPLAFKPSALALRFSWPKIIGVSMPSIDPAEPLPRPVWPDNPLIMLDTPLLPSIEPRPRVPDSISSED